MATSKKKKAGAGTKNPAHRRHHKNPFGRHHVRRHNPFPFSMQNAAKLIAAGAAGGLASAYIPNMLLPLLGLSDSGIAGYLANAAVAFLPPWLLSKYPNLATGWLVGGGTMLIGRIVDDMTGKSYIVYGSGASAGVSGMGAFQAPISGVVPLGGGGVNVFGGFSQAQRRMLSAGPVNAAGATPAKSAAPTGVGMGWVRSFSA